jgi:hypothetical protein
VPAARLEAPDPLPLLTAAVWGGARRTPRRALHAPARRLSAELATALSDPGVRTRGQRTAITIATANSSAVRMASYASAANVAKEVATLRRCCPTLGQGRAKGPLCRAFLCAEEDSNLHPVIPDQALKLVTRVSYPSLCVHIVQIVQPRGRYGRNGRSGCCHGCCPGHPAGGSVTRQECRWPPSRSGCCASRGRARRTDAVVPGG